MKTKIVIIFFVTASLFLVASCNRHRGGAGGQPTDSSASISPTPCQYVYSEWSFCQLDEAQNRTVLSSSPEGCTGTPILSQSCIYAPPIQETASARDSFPGSPSNPQYFITDNWGYAGKITTSATYTVQRLKLQMFTQIGPDGAGSTQNLRVGIFTDRPYSSSISTQVYDQPGTLVGDWSNWINASTLLPSPGGDVTFTWAGNSSGAPTVTPGVYWIVLNSDPFKELAVHAVAVATNDEELPFGECYSPDQGNSWEQFMFAKIKFALYDSE